MTSPTAYRYDIEGLRALCVITVISHHLSIPGFSGGFVGVDAFFVISGYVITRNILQSLSGGSFTLSEFYERRIRRLLPGLMATTFLTILAASVVMTPKDMIALSQSIAYTALAASNILFWRQAGYFDEASITKPMLHTWSLAVEEQFYFVYPILLLSLLRWRKMQVLTPLVIIALLSLSISVVGLIYRPVATFFLMPPRLWEMLAGGLLFLGLKDVKLQPSASTVLSCFGMGMLVLSTVCYTARTPFPGIAALLPVLGTAGLIVGGQSQMRGAIAATLGSAPLVYIGKTSYLLYLVHWPITVLWSYYKIEDLQILDKVLIIAGTAGVSFGIYRAFEMPIRSKSILPRRSHVYAMAAFFIAVSLAASSLVKICKGFPHRFGVIFSGSSGIAKELSEEDGLMKGVIPFRNGNRVDRGYVNPRDVATFGNAQRSEIAVFGDSHAFFLIDGVVAEARARNLGVKFYVNYASPPALGLDGLNIGGVKYNQDTVDLIIKDKNVRTVVLAAHWTSYLKGFFSLGEDPRVLQRHGQNVPPNMRWETLRKQLTETVIRLQEAKLRVAILEPIPDYKRDVFNTVERCRVGNRDASHYFDVTQESYLNRHSDTLLLLDQVSLDTGAIIIPTAAALRDGAGYLLTDGGVSLYLDSHHLSPLGSKRVASFVFRKLAAR